MDFPKAEALATERKTQSKLATLELIKKRRTNEHNIIDIIPERLFSKAKVIQIHLKLYLIYSEKVELAAASTTLLIFTTQLYNLN